MLYSKRYAGRQNGGRTVGKEPTQRVKRKQTM